MDGYALVQGGKFNKKRVIYTGVLGISFAVDGFVSDYNHTSNAIAQDGQAKISTEGLTKQTISDVLKSIVLDGFLRGEYYVNRGGRKIPHSGRHEGF